MIKNIIFDMGNVLNVFSPDMFIERLGVNEEDAKLLKEKVFFCREWVLLDWGYLTDEEAIEKIQPTLPENLRQYVPQLVSHWDEPMVPVDGMEELVKKLDEQTVIQKIEEKVAEEEPEANTEEVLPETEQEEYYAFYT